MRANDLPFTAVSISFKGATYMCVEGSERADLLRKANNAWSMGYDELSRSILKEALAADGCAFDARDAYIRDRKNN